MAMKQNFPITCPKCKQVVVLALTKKMAGKKLSHTCPSCNAKLSFTIPVSRFTIEETPTVVGEDLGASLSLQLSLIYDSNNAAKYQSFNLSSEQSIIGRKPKEDQKVADVEVETDDKSMSRVHAIIRKVKNIGFTIRNPEKPTNGIIINGQPKLDQDAEIYLNDGDVLRLGNTKFLVNLIRTNLEEVDVAIEK